MTVNRRILREAAVPLYLLSGTYLPSLLYTYIHILLSDSQDTLLMYSNCTSFSGSALLKIVIFDILDIFIRHILVTAVVVSVQQMYR